MSLIAQVGVSPVMLLAVFTRTPLASACVVLLVVGVVIAIYKVRQQWVWKRELRQLKSTWGTPQVRARDLETLREFHQICPPTDDDAPDRIDDQTWNDLNMDTVYAQVDRTLTTSGAAMLYRMLRSPLTSADALAQRARLIRVFQDDATTREALQLQLLSVGQSNARGLISLIWTDSSSPLKDAWVYYVLTTLAVISVVGLFMGGGTLAGLGIITLFLINMSMHYRVKANLLGRLGALRQLGGMIHAAGRIAKITHPELSSPTSSLRRASSATRSIARKVALLTPEGSSAGDIIATVLEYISIYFLHEVRTFHGAMVEIVRHRDELRTLFTLIGELDATQSVAGYRAGLSGFVEPEFVDASSTEGAARLDIQDARHPLFADPVANSIAISASSIAITGSNMSGKSSFLRTIGVNALLAQTINTCLAKRYRARPMRIISSMDESDDLLEGKSYYLAEAQRLLKIVRESERGELLLALIDEPLAGTNSPERLAASREILRHLATHNCVVLASTHDVELVSQLQHNGHFEPYHFSDQADDQGIRFDYRLRPGLDYHGNAIKVLKYLGYPDSIITGALASMAPADGG